MQNHPVCKDLICKVMSCVHSNRVRKIIGLANLPNFAPCSVPALAKMPELNTELNCDTVKPVLSVQGANQKQDQNWFSIQIIQGEHSAILSTFIMLPFVIKTFVLSIFEWPLKTGFTVINSLAVNCG